eukprot:2542830-Pyramimonas_sp.AAC.1
MSRCRRGHARAQCRPDAYFSSGGRASSCSDSRGRVRRRTVGAERNVVSSELVRPVSHRVQTGIRPEAIELNQKSNASVAS